MIAKPGGEVYFSSQVKLSSHHPDSSVFSEIFHIVLAGPVSNLTKWIVQKSGASTTNWSSIFGHQEFHGISQGTNSTRLSWRRLPPRSRLPPQFSRISGLSEDSTGSGGQVGSFCAKKTPCLAPMSSVVSPCRYDLFLDLLMKRQFSLPQYCLSKKKMQCSLNQLVVLLLKQVFRSSVSSLKYVVSDVCWHLIPPPVPPRSLNYLTSNCQAKNNTPPKCPSLSSLKTLPRSPNLGVALLMMWRHAVAIWTFSGLLAVAQPGVTWTPMGFCSI